MKMLAKKFCQLNRKKQCVCIVIVIIVAIEYFMFYSYREFLNRNIKCHEAIQEEDVPNIEDHAFNTTKNVFFIETSCKGTVDVRQACAVESAANGNPNWQVNLLFVGPINKWTDTKQPSNPLAILSKIKNVKFFRIHAKNFTRGTPLEKVFGEKVLNKSFYPVHHTSDLLRFLILEKYGGMYLDLDVVVVRPLDSLPENWVAKETPFDLASGSLSLSKNEVGQTVASNILHFLKDQYNPYVWNANSIYAMIWALQGICDAVKVEDMDDENCHGLTVFDPKYFYPYYYPDFEIYFLEQSMEMEAKDAYTHHMWNKLSFYTKIEKGSWYAKLAEQFCPTIYANYRNEFGG